MATTIQSVADYARLLANITSSDMSDSNATAFINDALYDLRRKLIGKRQDLFIKEASINITTAELDTGASPGKFSFASDMWELKNMQVNLTDVSNKELYVNAEQVDSSNLPNGISWEWMKKNQPFDQPVFDYRGNVFEIAPTPTAEMNNSTVPMVAAIKYFYFMSPTDLSTMTGTLAFPETFDFRILSYKVASIYFSTIGSTISADMDKQYEKRIDDLIAMIGTGSQSPLRPKGISDSGWNY